MNPDIERVTEAIWQHDDEGRAQRPGMWSDLGEAWQDYYRRMARAAVGAFGLTEERAILGYQQIGHYVGDTAPVVVLDDARATHRRLVGMWEELP